jgi:hypothetical protein
MYNTKARLCFINVVTKAQPCHEFSYEYSFKLPHILCLRLVIKQKFYYRKLRRLYVFGLFERTLWCLTSFTYPKTIFNYGLV